MQIDDPRLRDTGGDDGAGEVEPALAAVEDDAVGGDDDLIAGGQDGIGIRDEMHFPIRVHAFDNTFETAAVGHGAVEENGDGAGI